MEFQIDPDLLRIPHLMMRSCFINVLPPLFFYISWEKIGQDVLRNFVFWWKDKNKRGIKWSLSTCHWWETSSAVNELLQAELFTFLIRGWTFVWILIILNQTALELEPDSIVIAFPKQSFHHGKEMDNIYPHLVFLGKKI